MLIALTALQEKLLVDNSRTFLMAVALTHISSVSLATSGNTVEDAMGRGPLVRYASWDLPVFLGPARWDMSTLWGGKKGP